MTQLIGIARLGKDCEVRYTNSNEAVANLSLAFNYGRKGDDGKRPTQWVEASLWGQRAEGLSEHLLKGTSVYVVLGDVHIETFEGRNGEGHKLVGRVETLEFAGSAPQRDDGGQRQQPQQRGNGQQRSNGNAQRGQQTARPPQQRGGAPTGTGFDAMDDDIPFVMSVDIAPSKERRLRRTEF
jgi:single-strand DNA-binding protein